MVFKVGILGCGGLGTQHVQAYHSCRDVQVMACADPLTERAVAFRKKHGVLRAYDSYRELIGCEELDAVSICTADPLHAELAIAALQAGMNVLCEPPMALNSKQAEEVMEALRESDAQLSVVHHHRLAPVAQYLRQRIVEGMLGPIHFARLQALCWRGIADRGELPHLQRSAQGGVLMDLALESLDLAIWLMGGLEPCSVTGSINRLGVFENSQAEFAFEPYVSGYVKFTNASSVSLEASWGFLTKQTPSCTQLFVGKIGSATLHPFGSHQPALHLCAQQEGLVYDIVPEGFPRLNTRMAFVKEWVRCLREARQLLVEPQECLHVLRIVDALRVSHERHCEVVLEETVGQKR